MIRSLVKGFDLFHIFVYSRALKYLSGLLQGSIRACGEYNTYCNVTKVLYPPLLRRRSRPVYKLPDATRVVFSEAVRKV